MNASDIHIGPWLVNDPLVAVHAATLARRRADDRLRAALAVVPASRYAELGRMLGVSRQAAREAVIRAQKDSR